MEEFNVLEMKESEIVLDNIGDLSKLYGLAQAEEDFIFIQDGVGTITIASKILSKLKSGELTLSAKEVGE